MIFFSFARLTLVIFRSLMSLRFGVNGIVTLYFQNTITNADKLLAAADELAQTGECNPEEIYREAQELEERMHNFLTSLECRRGVLDMTVSFYSHVHEVSEF